MIVATFLLTYADLQMEKLHSYLFAQQQRLLWMMT